MDPRRFDAFARVMTAPESRRSIFRLAAGLLAVAGFVASPDAEAARRQRRRGRQRTRRDQSCPASCAGCGGRDETCIDGACRKICEATVVAGSPRQDAIAIHDPNGVNGIVATSLDNADVAIPKIVACSPDPVIVRVMKFDPSEPATVRLQVAVGTSADCATTRTVDCAATF